MNVGREVHYVAYRRGIPSAKRDAPHSPATELGSIVVARPPTVALEVNNPKMQAAIDRMRMRCENHSAGLA